MAYSNRGTRSVDERSRAALRRAYDRISRAVKVSDSDADLTGTDIHYIIEWLAFEASLLVRTGRYKNEARKVAVERAFANAAKAAKRLA